MICALGVASVLYAQHSADSYVPETDLLVQRKLAKWQDVKFGLFMHWGIYSQWGIEASWSLCSEDNGWNPREKGRFRSYEQYKEDYRNLRKVFNPTKFNPATWARAAKEGGMRYVVLTTKHCTIEIPESLCDKPPCNYAWTVKISGHVRTMDKR